MQGIPHSKEDIMGHTLFENAAVTQLGTAGRYDNAGIGTGAWASMAGYQNAAVIWQGTGAIGTLNVYKATDSSGANARVVSTLNTAAAGSIAAIEVNVQNFPTGGTAYTHISAAGTPAAGGTISGSLLLVQFNPRNLPTTNGLSAYGTALT